MSTEPFIGEITIFGFTFAPRGYALCNGQILSIAQNTALFSILGTTYGGNGQTTFALPNLQGRGAMHWGQGAGLDFVTLGEMSGAVSVTLQPNQLAAHTHTVAANNTDGSFPTPAGKVFAVPGADRDLVSYKAGTFTPVSMSVQAISIVGGNLPHNNLMPYLTLNYCIALQGIYPSRN